MIGSTPIRPTVIKEGDILSVRYADADGQDDFIVITKLFSTHPSEEWRNNNLEGFYCNYVNLLTQEVISSDKYPSFFFYHRVTVL